MLLTLDKDDSNWEVMSSVSSRTDRGYSRVMTRLLKKSHQLTTVLDGTVGKCLRRRKNLSGLFPPLTSVLLRFSNHEFM